MTAVDPDARFAPPRADDTAVREIHPHPGRLLLTELWPAVLGSPILVLLYARFRTADVTAVALAAAATLVLGALAHVVFRRSRRIAIGDTWVEGPSPHSHDPVTVFVNTLDPERSGVRRGKLKILSLSGNGIIAKTAWYAPEDIDEIRRLLRDRGLLREAS